MLATPTKDHPTLRNQTRDSSMSPSYRPRHSTPPRLVSASSDTPVYDSPMLTPSPLRQRPLFPNHFSRGLNDPDDLFLQSPYKSPAQAHHHSYPMYNSKPQPIPADDEEGSIFLASSSFSPFSPASPSQPLRTPVKQIYRAPSRSALAIKHMNTMSSSHSNADPSDALSPASRVGVGTKRKSTPHTSTPVRQHNLTPLVVASAARDNLDANNGIFDRLAPLAAPKFIASTPQSKAETDAHLKRQTATLTKLRITDAGEAFGTIDNDSGCEIDDEDQDEVLFMGTVRLKGKVGSVDRVSARVLVSNAAKGKEKEEVAEAISPGGHVIKRRARSRPVSAELLESAHRSPSPNKYVASTTNINRRNHGIVFPSVANFHKRSSSGSSSESGSPLPRRRVSNVHPHPYSPKLTSNPTHVSSRTALNRQESVSSATLFFGPAIPASNTAPAVRSRNNSTLSSGTPNIASLRSKVSNRHSYAGPGSNLPVWNTIRMRVASPSPRSSPPVLSADTSNGTILDHDEDMFFETGPQDSSFMFSVTEGTPSPRSKSSNTMSLPRKYKPRDSGVVLSDDEDDLMLLGGDYLNVMPTASTSVGSVHSDTDDNLVTPGFGPEANSGWPSVFVTGTDDASTRNMYNHLSSRDEPDIDAFIMRTLATAAKGPQEGKKKVPGTPVKRVKTTYLGAERPWQSAVAVKVGLRFDWDKKKGKVPRKSLPAAFPALKKKPEKLLLDQSTDSEGEEDSPSGRKNKYVGLGIGRPPAPSQQDGLSLMTRSHWLLRRSSSGAFSSESESPSSVGTPTRIKGKDWHLPIGRLPGQVSPSKTSFKLSPIRSASGSSSSSCATLNSPSVPAARRFPVSGIRPQTQKLNTITRRLSEPFAEEQPGRFDRDFIEVDEIGSGEFGKVIKVHRKDGGNNEVFAIKKSKRFEGARHRLRLWEEVEILKHLSQAAPDYDYHRHPNVLAYIDSWEENEALYIQTELCESGNLARFLWEYGRVFPRLDEDRVWKIIVDLSNGLRFIHDAGVIHLDLKPSNIFVTCEGRFKIGDFGMASLWPRPNQVERGPGGGFEREGDKLYLAPEVLQGRYGKAADVFSFGMTILETASNIVVPDQGEAWHRLRREDFSQVDLDESPELLDMIRQMMRTDPSLRLSVHAICDHPAVSRARAIMERVYITAKRNGTSVFAASPLASVHDGFLEEILGRRTLESGAMDVSL